MALQSELSDLELVISRIPRNKEIGSCKSRKESVELREKASEITQTLELL